MIQMLTSGPQENEGGTRGQNVDIQISDALKAPGAQFFLIFDQWVVLDSSFVFGPGRVDQDHIELVQVFVVEFSLGYFVNLGNLMSAFMYTGG